MKLASFLVAGVSALSTFTAPNGSSVEVSYDDKLDAVVFDAHVIRDSYLALGFGSSVKDVDVV